MQNANLKSPPPLCVDCDGTLVNTDLLAESILVFLKNSPLQLFTLVTWLLKGRAYLKEKLAEYIDLDIAELPYNNTFIQFLREEKSRGRCLVLVTAAPKKFAEQVAKHTGLFHFVLATTGRINLKGKQKANELVKTFGVKGFDYAANSNVDLDIWRVANSAILVNVGPRVGVRARAVAQVSRAFPRKSRIRSYFHVLRFQQWLKNLLLAVPLLAAHRIGDLNLAVQLIGAFVAFGLVASAGYVLNDLLDITTDRSHPRKRLRPFASGEVPIMHGLLALPGLLIGGLLLARSLSVPFSHWLVIYFTVTVAYSLWLKKILMLDVIILACLYSLRVIAGGVVTGIDLSFWLLAFALFVFFSLALVKRCCELRVMLAQNKHVVLGRGYCIDDLQLLETLGASSGVAAILVLALYINSVDVTRNYAEAYWLWLLCPLLLYWIGRMWAVAHRAQMLDDPVVFAVRDGPSRIVALVGLFIVVVASLGLNNVVP